MTSLRRPLASLNALVAYLAVHVGVAALHHHHPDGSSSPAVAGDGCCCVSAPDLAEEDDGDDHACPICNVLHLAQSLPTVIQAETPLARTGRTVTPPAVHRPHLVETAAHARAPPKP
jgi:hypothetical protein